MDMMAVIILVNGILPITQLIIRFLKVIGVGKESLLNILMITHRLILLNKKQFIKI
jgi:hypothetical protein